MLCCWAAALFAAGTLALCRWLRTYRKRIVTLGAVLVAGPAIALAVGAHNQRMTRAGVAMLTMHSLCEHLAGAPPVAGPSGGETP
jgi:hypothetical protein